MKNLDFETQVKQTLSSKTKLSVESELSLFTQAENLLAIRRELIASREAVLKLANQTRKQRLIALRQILSQVSEFLAIHPDTPAVATTFVALVLAFTIFQSKPQSAFRISYSDLPEFPKTNDFSARYDAQLLAERQAYEREVEDAHKKTSGGT